MDSRLRGNDGIEGCASPHYEADAKPDGKDPIAHLPFFVIFVTSW
jgi:hypothetical protein